MEKILNKVCLFAKQSVADSARVEPHGEPNASQAIETEVRVHLSEHQYRALLVRGLPNIEIRWQKKPNTSVYYFRRLGGKEHRVLYNQDTNFIVEVQHKESLFQHDVVSPFHCKIHVSKEVPVNQTDAKDPIDFVLTVNQPDKVPESTIRQMMKTETVKVNQHAVGILPGLTVESLSEYIQYIPFSWKSRSLGLITSDPCKVQDKYLPSSAISIHTEPIHLKSLPFMKRDRVRYTTVVDGIFRFDLTKSKHIRETQCKFQYSLEIEILEFGRIHETAERLEEILYSIKQHIFKNK